MCSRTRRGLSKLINPCSVLSHVIGPTSRMYEKCVCETRMPPVATNVKSGKISKSHIFIPPQPQGHVMEGKCERPLDEHTVQVWLLYDNTAKPENCVEQNAE